MWTDIDYMYNVSSSNLLIIQNQCNRFASHELQYKDFTVDPNRFAQDQFSQFVDKLHASGKHYGTFQSLIQMGVYVLHAHCTPGFHFYIGPTGCGEGIFPLSWLSLNFPFQLVWYSYLWPYYHKHNIGYHSTIKILKSVLWSRLIRLWCLGHSFGVFSPLLNFWKNPFTLSWIQFYASMHFLELSCDHWSWH